MFAPEQNTRGLALVMTTRANLGMLEADALERIVQLDIHAQIVGVQFQLVAGPDAGVFLDVERQCRNRAFVGNAPVSIGDGSVW